MFFPLAERGPTMISQERGVWFIHPNYDPPLPLRIQRVGELGALVTGGISGTHRTGHGQTYWDKLVEVIKLGYVPVPVAKELRLISSDWSPSVGDELDKQIASVDYKRKL
jgi:hypothetical protein